MRRVAKAVRRESKAMLFTRPSPLRIAISPPLSALQATIGATAAMLSTLRQSSHSKAEARGAMNSVTTKPKHAESIAQLRTSVA